MSSNIQIQRVCQYCGNEFTARTTVTKSCSAKCRKALYKKQKREEKIEGSNTETIQVINNNRIKTQKANPEEIKAKEFLNVREVSVLLGCSIRTVYQLIDNKIIPGANLGERLTRVKRSELDKIMEQPKQTEPKAIDISDCYPLAEVRNKYNISDKALYDVIKRNNIPKLKSGAFAYVPKSYIDKILS